ncbi:hypothetical protein ABBQ32_010512 [Trebouxia sp. C0010 RCD-2024]
MVITSPLMMPNEPQLCREMCQLGLPRLHLRKPGWSKSEAATFLSRLDEGTLRSVVLHDWHELADKFPVKGLHFTEKTRPSAPFQHKPPLTISTAFHDLSQLQKDYGDLDYALLSPIFDSISKKGYQAAFDHATLAQTVAGFSVPLVALGAMILSVPAKSSLLHAKWHDRVKRSPNLQMALLEHDRSPRHVYRGLP